jgi:hypothetical protein
MALPPASKRVRLAISDAIEIGFIFPDEPALLPLKPCF